MDFNALGVNMFLKGVWHEIFDFRIFFRKSVSPGPLSIPLGPFRIFSKTRRDIRKWMFISSVNDTAEKREKFSDEFFSYVKSLV